MGTPTQVAWGSATLGVVTAKNRATSTLLQANMSQAGSGAVGMMIWNSTHPNRSWVDSAVGNVATLTQPFVANTIVSPLPPVFFPAEVDTTTTGDSFTVQKMPKVYLADYRVTEAGGNSSYQQPFAFLSNVWVPDQSGTPGGSMTHVDPSVQITESRFDTALTWRGTYDPLGATIGCVNCWLNGAVEADGPFIVGGALNTALSYINLTTSTSYIGDVIVTVQPRFSRTRISLP